MFNKEYHIYDCVCTRSNCALFVFAPLIWHGPAIELGYAGSKEKKLSRFAKFLGEYLISYLKLVKVFLYLLL